MNEPLSGREVLCVSQFTLLGDVRKGTRPSFVAAAPADLAEPLYEGFCERLAAQAGRVRGAHGCRVRQRRPGDTDAGEPGSVAAPVRDYYEELWERLPPDPAPADMERRLAFLANELKADDVALDLGCGDGRFTAAHRARPAPR